jgi:hypothetical protein
MSDLNSYLNKLDRAESNASEIADDIEHLYKGIEGAHLYQNGWYRGWFTLEDAIDFATSNSINDKWTINEEQEEEE